MVVEKGVSFWCSNTSANTYKHCTKAASASFRDLNLAGKCRRPASKKYLRPDLLKLQTYSQGGEIQVGYSQFSEGALDLCY